MAESVWSHSLTDTYPGWLLKFGPNDGVLSTVWFALQAFAKATVDEHNRCP